MIQISLATIKRAMSRITKTIVFGFLLVFTLFTNSAKSQVSLTFSNGYFGTQNSAVQSTNSIKNFATLGIARVSFGQAYSGTFGGTQGNDLAGIIKIYLTSGTVISLNGALNWRETVSGNTVVVYGLIIDAGQSVNITYGASQTYTITGGSTSGTSTSIGLRSYLSTLAFTDGESRNGNAATSSIIDNMNTELANSPQPSTITLTNNSVTEGQNLVYSVALTKATTAGVPQVFTFSTSGTSSSTVDYSTSYTFSNGVTNNNDGTISVPGGVSSFTITVATIDDAPIESTETLIFSIGSKSATGSILDNDAIPPVLTISGSLKTFTSCSGCIVTPQSFTVSGTNLSTNNLIVTAPTGVQVSTNASSGFSSSVSLTPITGTVTTTTIYAKLTNNAATASSGVISVTSTGATSKTITVTTNTDNALHFDGTDYVNIPDNDALDLLTSFTIEAWVNPSVNTGSQVIIGKIQDVNTGLSADLAYALRYNGGVLSAQVGNGSTAQEVTSSNLVKNKWQHIAMVFNGADVSGVIGALTLYIDGVKQGNTLTTGYSTLKNVTTSLKFGSYGSHYDQYYTGLLDKVKIWNTVKTQADIAAGMNTELSGSETGLVAYYDFDNGTVNGSNTGLTTLSNKSNTASINGTLNGFALTGTTSNYVTGSIPLITATGSATSVAAANTLQLSNILSGGTWASSNTNYATVDASTGLVTGVASGSVSITYTICDKVVSYILNVVQPTITTTGTLKTFASCSGCSVNPQSFLVSGSNLAASITLTAPTGVVLSSTYSGTYNTSLSLSQTSGSVTSTTIYVKLTDNATSASSGVISVTSTGATSKTITVTTNTDNALNFDGVNDYIRLSSNVPYTNDAITIDAWIRSTANSTLDDIISWGNTTAGVNVVEFRLAGGKLDFILNDGTRFYQKTSTALINTGKWVHVAVVKSGTNVTLYIDGQVANTTSTGNSNSSPIPNITNIGILAYYGANSTNAYNIQAGSYFPGDIDQIRVWNTAKDVNFISANMNTAMSGSESDLVASFDFNQGIANGSNGSLTILNNINSSTYTGTLNNFNLTGTTSNFVPGFIPSITGTATTSVGASSTLSNTLTGGTWSSSNTAIATVNSLTGAVSGVAAGSSTITYTICEKTVITSFTVTVPTITTTGTLTAFSTCATTNSAAQTFTVSAQYLTSDLVLTAPAGYEIATTSGGTYSSTISIAPTSGSVSARLIYARTTSAVVNGQSGNIVVTSTGATTKNVTTGTAVVTQNKTSSVTITSNATNNTICSGASITFTANAINGGLTPTYQWKLNGVDIGGATNATYTTAALSSTSTITVVMGSSIATCLSGSPATSNAIVVNVNDVPNNPSVFTGLSANLTTICMNSNQVYSVAAVTAATSYTWLVTGSLSASVSSTTNVINITAANAAGSGTISVYANNACGTSVGSATLSVTVDNTPAPTANFTVSVNNVCLTSAGINFISTSTPNGTSSATISSYNWDFGDGNTASSTTASNTYTSSGNFDAILTIQASDNCTSQVSSRIIVDPISVSGTAAALKTTVCEGSNTTLSLTGNTGTIQWQSSTDGTSFTDITGANSANYTTPNLTTTTYYKAIVSSGLCTSASSGVVTVTVSPIPTVTIVAVADVLDNATSFNITYTNAIGNPDTYSIVATAPNSMTGFASIVNYGLLGSPINLVIPSSAVGTYNFSLTLENASLGCTSSAIPFTLNVLPQPPASLSYTSPNVYPVGTSITALTPTSTGGPIATYSIAPSLPAGLTLNTSTGIISGTPTATSVQTSYTVTGTNASGTITATVVITVNEAAPASLLYNTPNVYKVGTIITALNPTSTGGPIATYSIAPSLPTGLTLNTSTGIISGTPTATSVQTSYTVTGTNTSGTITATVVITVNDAAPASLSYNTPNVYIVGTTITALNPTSTGGPIVTYSIAPSLPVGLTLNTSTGIISGTPTVTSVQTSYIVTGTNISGTITATVVITVNEAAPASLLYTTPNVDTVGIIAQVLNPTSTGGPIVTYSIAPTLPAGLTLNTSTGVISGTPTVTSGQTTYIVTGTNASGTVTATVVITVKEAVPTSLSYNTPNVYTVGTIITALNPTSTGGPIATYSITPGLPAGLTFNTTTGVISGTPSVTSVQTSYTVTGTNASGTVTANVIITVVSGQPLLPQGGINAVDYKLLAADTVKIKLNIPTGASPFNLVIENNSNSLKDTITNVLDGDIINLSPVSNTTIYTIVKLTDNNGAVRTSGFNKDTTMVTILAPNIALTLKADKAIKLPDNSFSTKLLLKIKNSGEIDLKNVQVNANLSEVFPAGISYTLDSVIVERGTVTLNNGYKGNGSAKKPNSINQGVGASSGIKASAILDANYLFSNGVNMAINEESDINFYISIAPTSENVVLKLQFASAGEGVLTKSDGSTSQQSSIAASDDGINIATHPNITNTGTPAPTYLPLFPIASIGAALSASNPTIVPNGYTFDFVAKLKNFSNINLDTIAIINDFSKTFTSPDTAYIINTPVVTGGLTYNTNFNGYSNTLLIDSATKLVVGDSATIAYTLFVKTNKTTGSWSNSILGSGHSTIDYMYVSDISKDGVNPDPNGDNDPLEKGNTSFYVNYTPPAPPVVENKTYIFGTTTPTTIATLVKSYPTGSVPVWCDVATTLCSTNAPATPTIIGKYVYQLKSYDTTTKLYSITYVNDTVIIKPPVPVVKDSSYILGLNTNPANIGVQVVGMQGSVLNYFLLASRQTVVPVLGTSVSVKRYTVSQTVNAIESDTVGFNVTMLNQNDMLHLQKLAGEPILQSNSTFNITYKLIVNNLTAHELTNVLITDNLQNTIPITAEYSIVSINATGGLVANTSFNGSTNTYLTNATSKVNAFAKDTLVFTLNMKPKGFSGVMNNTATIAVTTPYGLVTMVSSAATKLAEITKSPTPVIIPDVIVDIPEVFSPNRDGVNDRFVIIKPFGTTLNLEIFNRWGNVVYANANYNNEWDGRGTNNFIGQDLLDGGYYYNLKAINKNGETKIFKGFVIIQR